MPTITFANEKKEIQVPEGANLRKEALSAGVALYPGLHQTKVKGDITVTTCPPLNLFGESFYS